MARLLIHAFPPGHRREFGDEMAAVLEESWRQANARGRAAIVFDVLREGAMERLRTANTGAFAFAPLFALPIHVLLYRLLITGMLMAIQLGAATEAERVVLVNAAYESAWSGIREAVSKDEIGAAVARLDAPEWTSIAPDGSRLLDRNGAIRELQGLLRIEPKDRPAAPAMEIVWTGETDTHLIAVVWVSMTRGDRTMRALVRDTFIKAPELRRIRHEKIIPEPRGAGRAESRPLKSSAGF